MDLKEILETWNKANDLRLRFIIETNKLCTMALDSQIPKHWSREDFKDTMTAIDLRQKELPRSNDPTSRYCEIRRASKIFDDRYHRYYEYQAKAFENVKL